MSNVPILGDKYEGLDEEQKAKLAQLAADNDVDPNQEPDDGPDAITAFLVIVGNDGNTAISTQIPDFKLVREATPADIKSALSEALDFFRAQQITQAVQQGMLQQMQMLQNQAQQKKILDGIPNLKGFN